MSSLAAPRHAGCGASGDFQVHRTNLNQTLPVVFFSIITQMTNVETKNDEILVNIKVPAKVNNIDKAIDLLGGPESLVEVSPTSF